jgi:hypothetical protein
MEDSIAATSTNELNINQKRQNAEKKSFSDLLIRLGLKDNWLGLDIDSPEDLQGAYDQVQDLIDKIDDVLANPESAFDPDTGEFLDPELQSAWEKFIEEHPEYTDLDPSNPEDLIKMKEALEGLRGEIERAADQSNVPLAKEQYAKTAAIGEAIEKGEVNLAEVDDYETQSIMARHDLSKDKRIEAAEAIFQNREDAVSQLSLERGAIFDVKNISPPFNEVSFAAASTTTPSFEDSQDAVVDPSQPPPSFS